MQKYERVPQTVFAQKFAPKDGPDKEGKSGVIVAQNKKYLWWVTQHASFCPTTDDFRGMTYQLCAPGLVARINPGDYIICDEEGKITSMSPTDFVKEYRLIEGVFKRKKQKE